MPDGSTGSQSTPPKPVTSLHKPKIADDETVLKGHVRFFDTDNDGIIWPSDVYTGFKALGFSTFVSFVSMIVILTFSYGASTSWIPDPYFRMEIKRMHRNKHGSDSQAFRHNGHYDAAVLDEFWTRFTQPPHDVMQPGELVDSVTSRQLAWDFYGWGGEALEWGWTWLILGQPTFQVSLGKAIQVYRKEGSIRNALSQASTGGEIRKDDVVAVYDGSMFYRIAVKEAKSNNYHAKKWQREFESSHGSIPL